MLLKIVSLFLVVMAVLAIFGKLRLPPLVGMTRRGKCPDCGRPMIGRGPCSCGGPDRRNRS
ncbi:hypothetical protein CCR83_10310 [Rhodobacter veldkampii DSM 11550]|uniref:Uncharacterized protein n=1 Tax=Phaeovulum veldkampii DSM 11550 TaxID=1185920 RepID=A0A2T4JIW7_9RHOB|nr:hypothetical protein [Phaeovulum veldkampii]MBK5946815.1 hypothetical protein [Phaeovulum veldkampii DSM 11550]NCU19575.1 hypothetical protein [Candidatus Falkowbacteria bacterium]PTE17835.1 hypothetical protein C5F46_07315 [Phaeovulum veldkampii DSM 11550]